MTKAVPRVLGEPPPPRVKVRTPEGIVAELARLPHPDVARDPDESLAALERLINEARVSMRLTGSRRDLRIYAHQNAGFSRAMKLVDDAPVAELRAFTRFVVDQLWGVGGGISKGTPRGLRFDREWEGFGILHQIALDMGARSFYPFTRR